MSRLNLLYKMDGLLAQCKTCKRPPAAHQVKCTGCSIYSELQELGENLGRKRDMGRKPRITIEEYQDLKAAGLSDNAIAERKDMTPISLRNWKYTNKITQERVHHPKETTPKTPKEDKTAEMRQLINDLSDSNNEKDKTIQELESKVQELEYLNAACFDVENESSSLQEELAKVKEKADGYLRQLLDTRDELIKKDYLVENQTKELYNLRITLERYEAENRALRDLVRVWV